MRFHGFVHPTSSLPHSIVSGGAPMILARVSLGSQAMDVRFLIDTGTDATVLHPTDAQRILDDDWYRIDFDRDPRRTGGEGVGGAVERVARDATLALQSEDRRLHPIAMPILIARPTPVEPGDHGNWRLPSLLGRDFLRHFRLELLCGEQRRVALETL